MKKIDDIRLKKCVECGTHSVEYGTCLNCGNEKEDAKKLINGLNDQMQIRMLQLTITDLEEKYNIKKHVVGQLLIKNSEKVKEEVKRIMK